jgi:formyltetrahydrofolate synthetase
MHSGEFVIKPGKKFPEGLSEENPELVKKGACNLIKQIENAKLYGVPVVVAINRFDSDYDSEIEMIRKVALANGAEDACISTVWRDGGAGGVELAEAVKNACSKKSEFEYLYPLDMSIKKKIYTIATRMYGAKDVYFENEARKKLKLFKKLSFDKLPICMAKTPLSLSHDPSLKGRPTDFVIPIHDLRISAGAGFIVALCGNISLMPGLPKEPSGKKIDIDENGDIVGLF